MLSLVEVPGGVLVLGRVTAADMAAFHAQAQVDPGVADLDAIFADVFIGVSNLNFFDMIAILFHNLSFSGYVCGGTFQSFTVPLPQRSSSLIRALRKVE